MLMLVSQQPRSQGPLSPSRKYPGCGWSRVHLYKSIAHRGWVFYLILSKVKTILSRGRRKLRRVEFAECRQPNCKNQNRRGNVELLSRGRERTLGTRLETKSYARIFHSSNLYKSSGRVNKLLCTNSKHAVKVAKVCGPCKKSGTQKDPAAET